MLGDDDSDLSVDQWLDRQYATGGAAVTGAVPIGSRRAAVDEDAAESPWQNQDAWTDQRHQRSVTGEDVGGSQADRYADVLKQAVQLLARIDGRLAARDVDPSAKFADALKEVSATLVALQDRQLSVVGSAADQLRQSHGRPRRFASWVALITVAAVAAVGALGWMWTRRDALRPAEPRREVASAADGGPTVTSAEWSALHQEISAYRAAAARSQWMVEVLAAPDLLRFDLFGNSANARSRGFGLVSRSRGILFTASSLPAAPANSAYQLWIGTDAGPIDAGIIVPDSTGRITEVRQSVLPPGRRVTSMFVTLEAQPPASAPAGNRFLAARRP